MTNISGGPKPKPFEANQVLEALKLNEATRNWVATEVPDDTDGEIGDVVFIPGGTGVAPIGGGGKVLQVVRATDTTARSTTSSTSFVDTSLSIVITPQVATSKILLIANTRIYTRHPSYAGAGMFLQITDSSNVAISGAEENRTSVTIGGGNAYVTDAMTTIAYDTPGSTAAKTYKLRMKCEPGNVLELPNNLNTNQIYAIEVAA
jgi:hypothetical protein